MACPEYNDEKFTKIFPEFSDEDKYPPELLEAYWEQASCYIDGCGNTLLGECTFLALSQMTAHMLTLATRAAKGKQSGYKTSSSIDKVAVGFAAPPAQDQFSWWLSHTPYGASLAALLEVKGVGGISVGGLPERGGFRKVGGVFY